MRPWKFVAASVLFSLFLATFMLAQPGSGKRGGGWGSGSAYGRMYDPNTVETVSGEVVKVEKFTPLRGMSGGIHVMLKTGPEEISVHLGPAWFFENQEQQIEVKDHLEVTGSRITYEGKPAIIAREAERCQKVLQRLRELGQEAAGLSSVPCVAERVIEAVKILDHKRVEFEYDGDMAAEADRQVAGFERGFGHLRSQVRD